MRARVERISHAGNRIVDEDRLQRLFTGAKHTQPFQRLLAARASVAVAINRARDAVDDAITVGECLNSFRDGFRRIRSALDGLSAKAFRSHKENVFVWRRRWAVGSLNDSLLDYNALRLLLSKRHRGECQLQQIN